MKDFAADRRSPLGQFPGQRTPRHATAWQKPCAPDATAPVPKRPTSIRRFHLFHSCTHPREMAGMDVNRFLTHLAVGAVTNPSRVKRGKSYVPNR